tara:strand:- start:299 stop:448 length:150 start_codon:yes stop_codon:yes gene_type:complete
MPTKKKTDPEKTDPEAPYHTPKGTPSEVKKLLRKGWVNSPNDESQKRPT